jgi:PhnB protein
MRGMEYNATSYRTVTPYLIVKDADAELRFLETAFGGAVAHCSRDDAGRIMHAEVTIGDSVVMLGQGNDQWPPKEAALYLWVPDVDATYAKGLAAGATSEAAPEDKPYGHRNAGVIDVNGVTWWIAAPVRH